MKYQKIESINDMVRKGLPVHEFVICSTYDEIISAVKKFNHYCTIRTDEPSRSKDLPFIVITSPECIKNIPSIIGNTERRYIVTNGLKYDNHLLYNMVYHMDMDGTFSCEFSTENVPLRKMYQHPQFLTNISGNINDNIRDFDVLWGTSRIDLRLIKDRMITLYEHYIYDRYAEIAVYKCDLDNTKKDYVFWQI